VAKVTFSLHLVVDPGTEGYATVATVPEGQSLTVKRITVLFPAGVYGELEIELTKGTMKVFPEAGTITGDNVLLQFDVNDVVYGSSENVAIRYRNTNSIEVREAFIYISGELE